MLHKALPIILVLSLGCGGTHIIGTDREDALSCAAHDECPGRACDVGVCRTACGSNYPGVSCATGELCDEWICRQSCSDGAACPAGTACDEAAGFICRPTRCGDTMACPLRYGCADGTCIPVGRLCSQQSDCESNSLVCVNGACTLTCGPNAPDNVCQTGAQCINQAHCGT